MELLIFGAQLSVTILVVIFIVATLLQIIIALLVRFDQWLHRPTARESTEPDSIEIPSDELSPEVIAVIAAAAAETYGEKKVRIKTIRYRRSRQRTSWVVQGRASIMASHRIK
jgi:hypothetical protein